MHEEAIRKADVLIEALGFIRKFHGKFTVIKLGGSVMEDPESLRALLVDVVFMQTVGLRPVVVHGGGKAITVAMEQRGPEAAFRPGQAVHRRADAGDRRAGPGRGDQRRHRAAHQQVRRPGVRAAPQDPSMPLRQEALAAKTGPRGPSTSGESARSRQSMSLPIENLCLAGVVPVLPSLAEDQEAEGQLLNVNADTAAAAVAQALQADKLVFLTDTPGILADKTEPGSLIRGLTPSDCHDLIAKGVIDKGMIPKVEACLTSLELGVRKTHIIDGRLRHSLLLEIFTQSGTGTEIVRHDNGQAASIQRPVLEKP